MKKLGVLFSAIAFMLVIAGCGGSAAIAQGGSQMPTKASQYTWKSVRAGGGGFIDGIIYHPAEKNLVYLRTDMGGAYRWDAKENQWVNITDMFGRIRPMFPEF